MKTRRGRQTPTQSVVLPYQNTLGKEGIALYEKTERRSQPWQQLMLYDILAVNEEGLWVHTKFGYSVPRRNGKNEIIAMRELVGLEHGEQILHTAHRTNTTHKAWERLLDLLEKIGADIVSTYRAYGKEHIVLANGGKIEFRTRTSKGGLGEGFDLLVIDEAQEYQDDQESALKYVVTDSLNPQTIFCGTPPTPLSSGTVFTKFRKAVLSGETQNAGWAEWSIEDQTDPNDIELWYETNPSLGYILTERAIADEIGTDDIDFNIQRLGLWIRYNQKSAISEREWDELKVGALPKLTGKLYIGIKYGHDGKNVAVSIAVKTTGGKIFVESIDCRPTKAGTQWITDFLNRSTWNKVIVDGASGQQLLADAMQECKLKKPQLPKVSQIVAANAAFEQAIFDKKMIHMNQPSLAKVISNCEHRAIGSNGGFGYKSIKPEAEIALMDSTILAYWSASESKDKIKQRIGY
jgi:phage terminase large subunit-like protein